MRHSLILLLTSGLALGLAGCGSDDDPPAGAEPSAEASETASPAPVDPAAEEPADSEPPAPMRMPITMGAPTEFAMVPQVAAVSAGKVQFDLANEGAIEHEIVVIPTDLGSGELPVDEGGAAIEANAIYPHGGGHDDGEMKHAGVHVASGDNDKVAFMLEPGKYAVVCNLPGHYASGMHANFDVK